ncbi:MAG: histidine kinase [Paenibacillaceae bacterium]|jgi:two-component system, sporulation sensor kinase E|nr:histidine kinase [Paenibacillaceae bacterium]
MINFVQRWKLVFIILGVISFCMALMNGLLLAGSGFGSRFDQDNWREFTAFQVSLLVFFAAAAVMAAYWLAVRMLAHSGGPKDSSGRMIKELEKTNGFLLSLLHNSADAIYIMDVEGKVLHVNPAFQKLYGFHAEEVAGQLRPFVPEHMQAEYNALITRVREGQQVSGYETVRRTKSGRDIHISLTVSPVLGEGGEVLALAVTSRNITERKRTEELLRRSEKLSAVGQLAAGVAHEIRNPLTTLRGFAQLLLQRDSASKVHLELMIEELDRINLIVSEFIILSKPHLNQFVFKDLGQLLDYLVQLLEPQARLGGIRIEKAVVADMPKVKCEENQLKQVFLNVIKNGMESMPEGGTMEIEVLKLEQERVMIRFTDNGTGIPEELLPRLGEPFLTSKENGTGLGIMVSQRIIANHKGYMSIRSQLGVGTCVELVLPVDFEALPPTEGALTEAGMTP